MKRGTKFALLLITLVVVAFVVLLIFAGARLMGGATAPVPHQALLEIDFERGVIEYMPDDPFAELMLRDSPPLLDLLEALEKAADDDRVVALVARVGNGPMGLAQVQELRDAVLAFRASGKKAVAWAETFGEFAPGNASYYLATAFDEIYLQPSGDVGLAGLRLESMFLRGTLDKLGVEPQMDHRKDYKAAMNTYTETGMTEAHRESYQAVLDSWYHQLLAGIAEGRGMDAASLEALVDRGPLLGPEALQAGLVDELLYRDQVYERLRGEVGEKAKPIFAGPYLESVGRPHRHGTEVALIYGVGAVVRGEGGFDPLAGSFAMGSDDVAAAFRAAIEDDDVEAILFRVDSPGGSYVASDTIWRETVRAREAGKPVVVSMGNLAGSGGYFVAMAADAIVAQPATITASIGVLGGKLVTTGLWDKLGVSFDGVQAGANADFFSSTEGYSEAGRQRLEAWLDRIYQDFTGKVAEGRDLDPQQVEEAAGGRIWTGEDALALGLVDELGGYRQALGQVRQALQLADDEPLALRRFPRPRSPFEALFGEEKRSSEDYAAAALAAEALRTLQPAVRTARQLGLLDSPRAELSMPPLVPVAP